LIARCLAFDCKDRPASAGEVAQSLRARLSLRPRAERWLRIHRRGAMLAAAALAAGGVLAAAYAFLPDWKNIQLERGYALHAAGDVAGAIDVYTAAIAKDGDDPRPRFARGRAHLDAGRLDEAWADFESMAEAHASGPAYACMGYCRSLQDRHWEARGLYERALPSFSSAALLNNLGYAYFKCADFDSATALLRQSIRLGGRNPAFLHNLALAMFLGSKDQIRNGAEEQADTMVEEAMSLMDEVIAASSNGKVYFDAAYIHAHAARRDSSRQELLTAKIISFCENVVSLGLDDGSKLDSLGDDLSILKLHPRYLDLCKADIPAGPPPVHLLDPLRRLHAAHARWR
jgi:tetratricopeptide (TPR) repeat protein